MPTPIDHSMMDNENSATTNSTENSIENSTTLTLTLSSNYSTKLFQRIIDEQKSFEEDPGINIGHITVSHNGYVLMLSGFKGYKENSTAFYRPSEEIWIYDQIVEKWIKKICTTETDEKDDMPIERSNACATIINNDYLYMFGGFSEEGNLNTLHRLNLTTLKWRKIRPTIINNEKIIEPLPCDKNVCWEYQDRLYLFGGYGPVPRQWNEEYKFQFIFDTSSHWHYIRGWNNQFVCYDPEKNCWKWPKHTGNIPTARAACAASKCNNYIYLFGGRMNRERMNDMYQLNMNTMEWKQIQTNQQNHLYNIPCGRSWHTLTSLPDQLLLVLYGGFSHDNQPLKDCWLFDIRTFQWREIILPFNRPRFWHSATLSTFGEILVLGGATKELISSYQRNPKYNHIFAKDMFAIKFQPKSLLRLCLSIIAENLKLSEQLFNILPIDLLEIVFKRCLNNNQNLKIKLQKSYQQSIHHQHYQNHSIT